MKNLILMTTVLALFSYPQLASRTHKKEQLSRNAHWTHQATLTRQIVGSSEGGAVALSADGTTLAVGAFNFNTDEGETQIYSRSGNTWQYQATVTQNIPGSIEGSAVALSADGTTLAVGAPFFNYLSGATQIYSRVGLTWKHQATLSQGHTGSIEGASVALSADGNTLAVGAPQLNHDNDPFNQEGATQVYVRVGSLWKYQATLTQSTAESLEGNSVALSSDGNTLAAGAQGFNGTGATHMYVRIGTTWKYLTTLTQEVDQSAEGSAVALTNGTLAAGAKNWNGAGATQLYVQSGAQWNYVTTLTQKIGQSSEGCAVALNNNTLAAGAKNFNGTGATQVYMQTGTAWEYLTTLTGNIANSLEGTSVALDNSVLAVGAPKFNQTGATQIYVRS